LLSFTSKSKSVATVREGAGRRWREPPERGKGGEWTQGHRATPFTRNVHDQTAGPWSNERRSIAIGHNVSPKGHVGKREREKGGCRVRVGRGRQQVGSCGGNLVRFEYF
jgi:hypothetical protein